MPVSARRAADRQACDHLPSSHPQAQARVVREAEGVVRDVAARLEGLVKDGAASSSSATPGAGSADVMAAAASVQKWAADTLQRLKGWVGVALWHGMLQ